MTPTSFPLRFRLLPWDHCDPETVDALGSYAETYWLPILHPTAYLLGRRLVMLRRTTQCRDPFDSYDMAHAIGVSERGEYGPNLGVYGRALKRLDRYRLVRIHDDTVTVKDRWPRLNGGLLSALSVSMQQGEPDCWAANQDVVNMDVLVKPWPAAR